VEIPPHGILMKDACKEAAVEPAAKGPDGITPDVSQAVLSGRSTLARGKIANNIFFYKNIKIESNTVC